MKRIILISGGTASLIMGIIGIFIPVLPTTPFMILSAGLYMKSYPQLYNRIVTGRLTARYITPAAGRPYFENEDSMTASPRGPLQKEPYIEYPEQ